MAEKPLVVVVASTSKQGWSVATELLRTGDYRVRALTRNTQGEVPNRLKEAGAELYAIEALQKRDLATAFQGAYAVFGITFPAFSADTPESACQEELEMAKNQADAAHEAGVKVFIFSGLENASERTKGKYNLPHFDSKALAQQHLAQNCPNLTAAIVALSFFYTNFMEYYTPSKDKDGVLTFSLPLPGDSAQPWTDAASQTGAVVAAILKDPAAYKDRLIPVVSEMLTPEQMVQQFTEVTGVQARYKQQSKAESMSAPLPTLMAEELYNMFQFCAEYGYFSPESDLEECRRITSSKPRTWRDILKLSKWTGTESFNEVKMNVL